MSIESQGTPNATAFNILQDAQTGERKYAVTTYYQLQSLELRFDSRLCAEFFFWERSQKYKHIKSDPTSVELASARVEDLR